MAPGVASANTAATPATSSATSKRVSVAGASRAFHRLQTCRIDRERFHRECRGRNVSRFEQDAVDPVVDQLLRTAAARADHRPPALEGFRRRATECFVDGARQQDVAPLDLGMGIGGEVDQLQPVAHAEIVGQQFEDLSVLGGDRTDESQRDARALAVDGRERAYGGGTPLRRRQPPE